MTREDLSTPRLFCIFQPKPVFPACQGDDGAGCVVIVGGLPRGPSLVVERGCGTADDFIQRLFLGKRQRVPSRSDVDPEQVGQAGRAARAVDALIVKRGQLGFGRLRFTLRNTRPVYHNSREHETRGHQAERQHPVGSSAER